MTALTELLLTVLRMSTWGTLAACVVLLVWLLARRLRCSRTPLLLLWAVVAFRLLSPWAPASGASLFRFDLNLYPTTIAEGLETKYAQGVQSALEWNENFDELQAQGLEPVSVSLNPRHDDSHAVRIIYYETDEQGNIRPATPALEAYGPTLTLIWVIGAGVMLGYGGLSCLLLKRRLRFAVKDPDRPGVWYSDRIQGPCVVGLLRPRIYLTFGLTDTQREHILAHERQHLRTGDHWWKALAWVILSIHWFNLFLWGIFRAFVECLEEACDQRALRDLGEESRAAYGQTLLDLSAGGRTLPFPTPVAFGEGETKERVKSVLRYRRPLAAATVLILAVGCAACVLVATAPEERDPAAPLELKVTEDGYAVELEPLLRDQDDLGPQVEEARAEIRENYARWDPLQSTLPGSWTRKFDTLSEAADFLGVSVLESAALAGATAQVDYTKPDKPLGPPTYWASLFGASDGTIRNASVSGSYLLDGLRIQTSASLFFDDAVGRTLLQDPADFDRVEWEQPMANGGAATVAQGPPNEKGYVWVEAWFQWDKTLYFVHVVGTEGQEDLLWDTMLDILNGYPASP